MNGNLYFKLSVKRSGLSQEESPQTLKFDFLLQLIYFSLFFQILHFNNLSDNLYWNNENQMKKYEQKMKSFFLIIFYFIT